MENWTMFSRFSPPAAIRASQDRRAVQEGRRTRPGHRHPDRTRARFWLEALEDRCLLSGIAITEYPTPYPKFGASVGIATGPDGNLWFTDKGDNAVGMINPTTHAISEFTVPTTCWPYAIAAGPDGNLWFTEALTSKIAMINPTTDAITEFAIPYGNPRGITVGPDGNLWFTQVDGGATGYIGMINPTTHAISEFAVPTYGAYPWWITPGPDGNLWFTEWEVGKIGVINPTTHVVKEFAIPTSGSDPFGITSGADGNLWFTEAATGNIGIISPTTDAITQIAVGGAGGSITAGPDGNLWFAAGSNIGAINPTTEAIAEYPVPYTGAAVAAVTTGPDGNMWFTDGGTKSIGVATLETSELVVTQQPPASVTAGSGFGLTVTAENSSGNPITTFNGTVTVAIATNPGGATLGGTLTATASNGVAAFSGLTLNKAAAGYTLEVSAAGLGSGVTGFIAVTPAAATQLVITQQPPATVKVSTGFGLQASIEDQYGNVVTTAANTVSVALDDNPTGATLGGALSVSASQGVATLSGLTINKTGNGYTLQVSSAGLSGAVSSAINVTKTGNSAVVVATAGTSAPDPLLGPLVLDSPDFLDSLRLKKRALDLRKLV
jgi:streptogramin lyase